MLQSHEPKMQLLDILNFTGMFVQNQTFGPII